MAIKEYKTDNIHINFNIVDSDGSYGTSGQVLSRDAGGVTWVDGSGTVIGGPYLPLAGGIMTGAGQIRMPDNFQLQLGTSADMEIYHNGTNTIFDNQTGALIIQNNTSERMRITSAGDVGIGTTGPIAKLHVNATNVLGGNSGNFTLLSTLQNPGGSGGNNVYENNWSYRTATGTDWPTWSLWNGISVDASFVTPTTSLTWHWREPNAGKHHFGSGGTNVMTIGPSNVGIGTTSPAQKLDVAGKIVSSIDLTVGNNSSGAVRYSGQNGYYSFITRSNYNDWVLSLLGTDGDASTDPIGNQLMTVNYNGNVGIGTTSPSADLHVNSVNAQGTVIIGRTGSNIAASTGLGIISFPADYNSSPTNYAQIRAYSNALSSLRGSLDFNVKSTSGSLLTGLTVYGTSSGANVGIGTDSPEVLLTLSETTNNTSIGFYNTGTNAANRNWVIGSNDQVFGDFAIMTSNAIGGNPISAGVKRFYINPSGNVGIGTTTPAFTSGSGLAIHNDSIPRLKLSNSTSGQGATDGFELLLGGVDAYVYNYEGGSLILGTSATERMRIDSTGNVGIGTTSPGTKLEVVDSTNAQLEVSGYSLETSTANAANGTIFIGNNSLYRGVIDYNASSTSDLIISNTYNNATSGIRFKVATSDAGGITAMKIRGNGNVGIGTASPGTFLQLGTYAVAGKYINQAAYPDIPSEHMMHITAPSTNAYYGGGISFGEAAFTAANIVVRDAGGSGALDLCFGTGTVAGVTEKMRITNAGGISFGSTGTAYGTSGQVLTSAGNASPTWTTPTTGTVTGTGTATQVAFWDGTSSLSGSQSLYWDNTNNHLGIGDATPGSKLKVVSGTSETSIYTVDINHIRNNPDVATNAVRINMDLSGADNTTADRVNSGLFLDIDSSADGDASNEHRIYGVYSDVRFSGFSDLVRAGYFLAESNNITEKTGQLVGVFGNAVHDASSTSGGVTNMYGAYGISSIQDLGDVDNAFGGFFLTQVSSARGNANVGVTKGVEGRVSIDKATTISYGEMTAVSGVIDNNEGTVPTFGNQYLFKGDYQGTKGGSAYGIYTEGDKHYFDGKVGIGVTGPSQQLHIVGNARVTGAYYDSNNSPGTSGQVLSSTVTGTDWVTPSSGGGIGGSTTATEIAFGSATASEIDSDPGLTYTSGGGLNVGDTTGSGNSIISMKKGSAGISRFRMYYAVTGGISNGFDITLDGSENTSISTAQKLTIATGGSQHIILSPAGNVGIGTTSPTSYKLEVTGTGGFTSTVTASNFILSSDERLKNNIKNIDDDHIDVDWKNFELKSEPGIKRSGVIAQELEEKHPEFVRTDKEGLKSVAYIDLLIAKIAELEARLEKAGI